MFPYVSSGYFSLWDRTYLKFFRAKNGEGNGTPLQYSCLENPMGHGVAKSRARLSDFTFTFHFPALEKEMGVFLPGESQGRRNLVGCRRWSRTELDTTEAT